jgi:hypothetical protein
MEMVPVIILKNMSIKRTSGLLYREENWPRGLRPLKSDGDDDDDIYVVLPYELGSLDSCNVKICDIRRL